MIACTLTTIAALIGHPVERGDRVDVPRWRFEQASLHERSHAKACLRRFDIRWRIVG